MKHFLSQTAILTLLSLTLGSAVKAQIVNGSFESGVAPWVANNVDYLPNNNFWNAYDGTATVDVSGSDAGNIAQQVVTTNGQAYQLSFAMAGNFYGGNSIKTMQVVWDNILQGTFTYSLHNGDSATQMTYDVHSITVTGTGTDTVKFISLDTNYYGPVLDGVTMSLAPASTTPEPGSIALLIGLSISSGLFTVRRRRSRQA